MRNVATKNWDYVAIGGSTDDHTHEDLEFVNLLIRKRGAPITEAISAPIRVEDLMEALVAEGYIDRFHQPEIVKPLSGLEKVAKYLMEAFEGFGTDDGGYGIKEFRAQSDYKDFISHAKTVIDMSKEDA